MNRIWNDSVIEYAEGSAAPSQKNMIIAPATPQI
jgi:hypothetical protein